MGKNAQERRLKKAERAAERKATGVAVAIARNIRMSPIKARRVIDLIRGKDLDQAIAILNFTPNAAAEPIRKCVESAAANAENNDNLNRERLYVKTCFVDAGFTFKRVHPTTMGRARVIRKRTSHITVHVAERPRLRAARRGE